MTSAIESEKSSTALLPKSLLIFLALIWGIYLIDVILVGFTFNVFGIRPRSLSGLIGVFTSPFLHGSLGHLISNSISLFGTAVLLRMAAGTKTLNWTMFGAAIGAGVGTWLFSTGGIVVGASGMIYGLLGFLFAHAYFQPSIRSWAGAIVAFVLFGGALMSFFNFMPYISWSAHFWGFISGIGMGYLMKPSSAPRSI